MGIIIIIIILLLYYYIYIYIYIYIYCYIMILLYNCLTRPSAKRLSVFLVICMHACVYAHACAFVAP